MKKIASLLLALSLIICVLFALPVNVDALATDTKDGLVVSITTDKEQYSTNETAQLHISIQNTNTFDVTGISVEKLFPEEISLVNSNSIPTNLTIKAGEIYQTVVNVKYTAKTASTPSTGDTFPIILFSILAIISAVAVFVLLKYRKGMKVLSILLCMIMLFSMIPAGVYAALVETSSITVDKAVRFGNNSYTLRIKVTYPADVSDVDCTVTFNSNGGSAVETQTVQKGLVVLVPEVPSYAEYVFLGWYADEALTELYAFSAPVLSDITLYAKWAPVSDLSIQITNENYIAETKSFTTEDDQFTLTGTVTGAGEIAKVCVAYNGYGQEATEMDATGTSSWSVTLPLEDGTNTVKIYAHATDNSVTETIVYINKTTPIKYKETVKVADVSDYQAIYDNIIACWVDDNSTADFTSDDSIILLVTDTSVLLDQINDGLINTGDTYMIPENDLFVVGFTGVYQQHRAPIGCESYPAADYPDSQYEEIVFSYPSFSDIFDEAVSLDFSSGVDASDPIAFVMAGDGSQDFGTTPSTRANLYYGEPGWTTKDLFDNILPSFTYSVDTYNRMNFELNWSDIVVYDDDGKKNSSGDHSGQLLLNGKFSINNIDYTGGVEWHPSLVPWAVDILPQQVISKLTYTKSGELSLGGKTTAETSDLVKKINKYKNQKEFLGMKVSGVDTFETKIVVGIIGVNLSPITVKPYKTLKGLAASSTVTTPKLFFYIFIDLDGNVTIEGSTNLKYSTSVVKGFNIQKNGFTGAYGTQAQNRSDKHYNLGSDRTLDVYDSSDDNGGLNLSINGKVSATLDLGVGVGAGLMVCGLCPATIDGQVFIRANGEANGTINLLPDQSIEGYAGLYFGFGFQADAKVGVKVDTVIGDASIKTAFHYENMFWEKSFSTSKFDGTVYVSDDDSDVNNNGRISDAKITLTNTDTGSVWTTTTNENGQYAIYSIPNGKYTIKVEKDGFDTVTLSDIIFNNKLTQNVFLNEQDPWNGICSLSGKIVIADTDTDMSNNAPLPGANIQLENIATGHHITVVTGSDGTYEIGRIPPGNYRITISKTGYITIYAAVAVADNMANYYNATMEAISDEYTGTGTASGTIYDAVTGRTISGLTLEIRSGINDETGTIAETLTTNGSGKYTTGYLPAGNYTVTIVDNRTLDNDNARYMTSTFTIKILGGKSIPNQDGYTSNNLLPDQVRIVLKWGSTPSDLDSHMVGPSGTSGSFHTFYRNKTYNSDGERMADLDLDDTTSYGPETTTIYHAESGIYTFLVHDYSNRGYSSSTAMANSGAYVEVFLGISDVAVRRFNVPNAAGTVWTVFSYNSNTGEIIPINTMSSQSDPSNVGYGLAVRSSGATRHFSQESAEEALPVSKDYGFYKEDEEQDIPA